MADAVTPSSYTDNFGEYLRPLDEGGGSDPILRFFKTKTIQIVDFVVILS